MLNNVIKRHLGMMEKNRAILALIFRDVTQEAATTYRDGGDGWTALETLCHLRDFDRIFHERAVLMLNEAHPQLPGYDHEALVAERDYNNQDLQTVLADFMAFREQFIAFFRELTDEQWQRTGVHPENGDWTMLDSLTQVASHDITHIEQIMRILVE